MQGFKKFFAAVMIMSLAVLGIGTGLAFSASALETGTVFATNTAATVTLQSTLSGSSVLTWTEVQNDTGVLPVTTFTQAGATPTVTLSAANALLTDVAQGNVVFDVTDTSGDLDVVTIPIKFSAHGTAVVQTSDTSHNLAAQFHVREGKVQSGVSDTANECLDNSNFNWSDGNHIQIWSCGAAGGADQNLEYITVGHSHELAFVDPHNSSLWCVSDFGRNVTIESCGNVMGDQQVTHLKSQQYQFSNGIVLDDQGASTHNGTPVIGYVKKSMGTSNQEWSLPS